jgi:hypothetical protein
VDRYSSSVVKQSTHYPKFEGFNPATTATSPKCYKKLLRP